jgi:hypothetical protein
MLFIVAPLLCSCTGYDGGSSGIQRAAGKVRFLFDCAQSRGSVAAERVRHTISAGRIAANREKYQRVFNKSIFFLSGFAIVEFKAYLFHVIQRATLRMS